MLRTLKRSLVFAALPVAVALGAAAAGWTTLPTEWSIAPPPDLVVPTRTLPVSARLTADGASVIVVEAGQGGEGIRLVDPSTLATQRRVDLRADFGEPVPDAQGAGFWVSAGNDDAVLHVDAALGKVDRTIALTKGFWPSALARSSDGKTLAVSGDLADAIVFVDLDSGKAGAPVKVGHHPAGIVFAPDGKRVYVANWAGRTLSVVDVASGVAGAPIAVGEHPEKLLLSHDGTKLFVAETDDDAIGIVDLATARRIGGVNVGLYDGKLFGASPSSLALSPDGRRLYVACGAANAIVVLDVAADGTSAKVAGAIPTGWYPTAATLDPSGRALIVADGKGEGSPANPTFDYKLGGRGAGYVATATIGSLRRIPLPDAETLTRGVHDVREHAGPFLGQAIADAAVRLRGPAGDEPGRAIVKRDGPIRHVIYIIKENRSYDQVLGDLGSGNGDPALTLFGAAVTPNQHAFARRFGIFDNTYADAQISPDGHNWSMGAFANDYLEKMWPQGHRPYDFEDGADASVAHGRFIWDEAAEAGLTYRNYGEFVELLGGGAAVPKDKPETTHTAHLEGHTDLNYRGYDTSYNDADREREWAREFAGYVERGDLPSLEIVRLPDDHTSGTRPGERTPSAMVAENDLAFGRIVDAVSHSKYWASTAIFAIEDDAQNGADHVDDQRTTLYLASPYARAGIRHEHYSSAGVLRTIELILGLPPMSAYDAAARPLYAAFGTAADQRPYEAITPSVDRAAKNAPSAYRARDSARLDFSHADAVPPAVLNDILWHAVRGAAATPPPYGAFDRK